VGLIRRLLWVCLIFFVFISLAFFRGLFWISVGVFMLVAPWLLLYATEREERRRRIERLRRMPARKRRRVRFAKLTLLPGKAGEREKRSRYIEGDSHTEGQED
jgi:hypothetical protein